MDCFALEEQLWTLISELNWKECYIDRHGGGVCVCRKAR